MEDSSEDDVSKLRATGKETADENLHDRRKPKGWRSFLTEPAVFFYFLAVFPIFTASRQYLYAKIGRQHNFNYLDRSEGVVCEINHTDPDYLVQQEIQQESSEWLLYFDIAYCIMGMISTVLLGSYSDTGGRKIAMIIPILGGILEMLVYLIDGYFDLHISFLMAGHILHGLSGSWMIFSAAAFAYIADVTVEKERTFRVAFLMSVMEIGGGGIEIAVGYFIKATGFAWPFLGSLATLAAVLLYIIVVIPETVDIHKKSTAADVYKSMYRLYFKDHPTMGKRRWKLVTLLIVTFLVMLPITSPWDVLNLKLLNYPLCFNSVLVGYFACLGVVIRGLGSLGFVKLFSRCLDDVWLFVIGGLSGVLYYTLVTVARSKVMMFLAPVIGFLWSVPSAIIRSIMSKTVGPDEQGTVLSSIGSIQTISSLIGHAMLNAIYTVTVATYDGVCFLILAAFCLLAVVMILFYHIRVKIEQRQSKLLDEKTALIN